jgi:hypothetical protein
MTSNCLDTDVQCLHLLLLPLTCAVHKLTLGRRLLLLLLLLLLLELAVLLLLLC